MSMENKNTKNLSFWQKLLLYSFNSKGNEVCLDYLWYKLSDNWSWKKSALSSVYGETIFKEELESAFSMLCNYDPEIMFSDETTVSSYHSTYSDRFRLYYIRNVIEATKWDVFYDLISEDDISGFFSIITKNKIWNDIIVRQSIDAVYKYMRLLSEDVYKKEDSDIVGSSVRKVDKFADIDFSDAELSHLKEFEVLEKKARKASVPEMWHEQIDKLDLTALKINLRDQSWLMFAPRWYQAEFLINHRRFNFIVTCRWAGKTFLCSYLVLRWLFLNWYLIWILVPDKLNYGRPMFRFLKTHIGNSEWFKMSMTWSNVYIRNIETNAEVIFFAANKDPDSIRGNTIDLLIWEEAAFSKKEARDAAKPCLTRERFGMAVCITTVDKKAPRWWFHAEYSMAKVVQINPASEYMTFTVTIHDNPFITAKERERVLRVEKNLDIDTFNAEWMCLFVDEESFPVANYVEIEEEPIIIETLDDNHTKTERLFHPNFNERWMYDFFLICYDCASQHHGAGVVVLWANINGNCDTVCTSYLRGWYFTQAQTIKGLVDFMTINWYKFAVLLDYLWVWVAVSEILDNKWVDHIKMQNSLSKNSKVISKYENWRLAFRKSLVKDKVCSWMAMGYVKWFSFQEQMLKELTEYSEKEGKQSDGQVHHYDLANALLLWFAFWHDKWLIRDNWFTDAEERFISDWVITEASVRRSRDLDVASNNYVPSRYSS